MTKKQRQEKILQIINEYEIDTQEGLTLKLKELGLDVTQATISRDIKEMHLTKIQGKVKKFKYAKLDFDSSKVNAKLTRLFKESVVSFIPVNNMILIKTLSGTASNVGFFIDNLGIEQILGSIAGDDTILVITKSNFDADFVIKKFKEIIANAE
ncbi:MAG: arginine repressor [Clostridiales bacterium]|nr:arginine repressor [Clostridiales bacterium]